MGVVAEFALSPAAFVLEAAIRATSTVRITLDGAATHPSAPLVPHVTVQGDHRALTRFDRALPEDATVADAVSLSATEGERRYRVRWNGEEDGVVDAFAGLLEATGVGPTEIAFDDRVWTLRIHTADRRALRDFYEASRDFFELELLSVTDRSVTTHETPLGITQNQYEALSIALERGYYGVPKECTVSDIADELDISPQAVSQRLR